MCQVWNGFGKNGGKQFARLKTIDSLVGEDSPEMMAVIEFDSQEVISEMIKGEEFNALADQRTRVFSKLNLMISQNLQ